MGKKAYILLILMLLALSMANVIHAQNTPKPSVPEFAVSLINGASVSRSTSTELVVKGIEINITNQPYAFSFNGTTYVLCYDYRYKAYSAQNWEESSYSLNNSYPPQSNSNTTILSIQEISIPQPPGDVQIDFQVQAIAGHYYQTETGTFIFPDETSGWSPTHTITITLPTPHTQSPPSSPSPTISPSPTQQPITDSLTPAPTTAQKEGNGLTDFQLLLIIGLPATAIIIGVGVALNIRNKKKPPEYT